MVSPSMPHTSLLLFFCKLSKAVSMIPPSLDFHAFLPAGMAVTVPIEALLLHTFVESRQLAVRILTEVAQNLLSTCRTTYFFLHFFVLLLCPCFAALCFTEIYIKGKHKKYSMHQQLNTSSCMCTY